MRQAKKILIAVLLFGMCFAYRTQAVYAEKTPYTYTVTFFAGNRGNFVNGNGLTVENGNGSIRVEPGKITVSGLKEGDIVSFNTQAGSLSLLDSGKYYVRGVRKSGRDNGTVAASAFRVTGDADYVAAYGIKGNTVAYTVNYEDADGNTLLESNTYYGNIGDKPVVAYAYIENYTPDVLAITKTLSANEAENVFTFVYTLNPGQGEDIQEPPERTESGRSGLLNQVQPPSNQTTDPASTNQANTTPAAATAAPAAAAPEAAADAADAADADVPAVTDDTVPADGGEVIPDDDVPLNDSDLRDMDDENDQVPTSNINLPSEEVKKGLPLALYIGLGTAAGIGLAVMAFLLMKRRKKAKCKAEEMNGTDKSGE